MATLAGALGVSPPTRRIPVWLAVSAGLVAEGWSALTRTPPTMSRELARLSAQTNKYSNQKAREELGVNFRPFEQTAQRLARLKK